jgi:hypothetical protein
MCVCLCLVGAAGGVCVCVCLCLVGAAGGVYVCVCLCLVGAAGEEGATLKVLRHFRIGSKLSIRIVCHHEWGGACVCVC